MCGSIRMEIWILLFLLLVSAETMMTQACDGNVPTSSCGDYSIVSYLVKTILDQEKDLAQCRQQQYECRNTECETCPVYTPNPNNDLLLASMFDQPKEFNNKTYYLSAITANSPEAARYCSAIGGYQAEIDDANEYQFVKNITTSSDYETVFIAGTDAENEGKWVFTRTGEIVPYLNWRAGEPNNRGRKEHCLVITKSQSGKMNDAPCETARHNFLCEV